MNVLVVVEHDNKSLRSASLAAIGFAQQLVSTIDGDVQILVLGHQAEVAAGDAADYAPVVLADDPSLQHPLPIQNAATIADVARGVNADILVAASSTWSKDIVGRAAGLLGGAMASDVIGHDWVDGRLYLRRPMYAGAVNATVVLHGNPQIITIRSSAFPPAAKMNEPREVIRASVQTAEFNGTSQFEGLSAKPSQRPDVTDAQIVISGGRAFKNSEDFERLVGGLADRLGAATGSSRALVDAGITPNSYQVGQTGKVVAPDLYMALGISGAVQHLAGMKNSKIVVAINQDRDAPIFEVADYGLVGDVYELIPELMEKL